MTDYTTDSVYYIMLSEAIGVANRSASQIIYNYGSARAFMEAGSDEWRSCGLLPPAKVKSLEKVDITEAEAILSQCNELGISVITPEDDRYPERLKRLSDMPLVLYVKGDLPDIDNEVAIGMVGTRKASEYGCKVAHIISCGVAKAGGLIVSGGAVGIDSIAHKAAIMCKGKTVAVLGCGINSDYLKINKSLRDTIAENGAVVSEYPPDAPASRFTFPIRNRIISGLSLGVCVVEAGARSGSLITANHALNQGRDVFVAPGSAISPSFEGTNRLLRDGAKPVFSATDILEEYASQFPHKINLDKVPPLKTDINDYHIKNNGPKVVAPPPAEKVDLKGVSEAAKIVYDKLGFEAVTFDKLQMLTGLDTGVLMRSLTELEIYGVIIPAGGNKYSLKS